MPDQIFIEFSDKHDILIDESRGSHFRVPVQRPVKILCLVPTRRLTSKDFNFPQNLLDRRMRARQNIVSRVFMIGVGSNLNVMGCIIIAKNDARARTLIMIADN